MSDDERDGGDSTRAGGMRPPPRIPAPGSAPPPAAPEAKDETASKSPPPPKPPEVLEEGTQIYVRPKVTLTRLGPPGHSGVIPLESGAYRIGRSSQCDILLYAPASSRVHAHLRREESGWVLEPEPGKLVVVDGETVTAATALGPKARLRLGGDDLLFLDESRASSPAPAAAEESGAKPSRARFWLILAAALLAVAALLRFLLG